MKKNQLLDMRRKKKDRSLEMRVRQMRTAKGADQSLEMREKETSQLLKMRQKKTNQLPDTRRKKKKNRSLETRVW